MSTNNSEVGEVGSNDVRPKRWQSRSDSQSRRTPRLEGLLAPQRRHMSSRPQDTHACSPASRLREPGATGVWFAPVSHRNLRRASGRAIALCRDPQSLRQLRRVPTKDGRLPDRIARKHSYRRGSTLRGELRPRSPLRQQADIQTTLRYYVPVRPVDHAEAREITANALLLNPKRTQICETETTGNVVQ